MPQDLLKVSPPKIYNLWENSMKIKKWIIRVTILTFILAVSISFISEVVLKNLNIFWGFLILTLIVFLGIIFDMVGIAVTICEEHPFHSMAARKNHSARYSIKLIRNASQVSNFCNDVIGDISGIISGTALVVILRQIFVQGDFGVLESVITILFSALIAAITVGGKAMGKDFAKTHSRKVVRYVGEVLYIMDKKFKIRIFK